MYSRVFRLLYLEGKRCASNALGLNFVLAGSFLVFRHPFGVVSKMIAEEMNSDSDELTCSEQLRISSSLIAIAYTNRKMLRDLIFLVCLILAKAVL